MDYSIESNNEIFQNILSGIIDGAVINTQYKHCLSAFQISEGESQTILNLFQSSCYNSFKLGHGIHEEEKQISYTNNEDIFLKNINADSHEIIEQLHFDF